MKYLQTNFIGLELSSHQGQIHYKKIKLYELG